MIEIHTQPDRKTKYPCFEIHGDRVVVYPSYTDKPRVLSRSQFAREYPHAIMNHETATEKP